MLSRSLLIKLSLFILRASCSVPHLIIQEYLNVFVRDFYLSSQQSELLT